MSSPPMRGSWLPASPSGSFVEASALTASPLPGVAIGRTRPVTSLHASPHLKALVSSGVHGPKPEESLTPPDYSKYPTYERLG